MPNVDSCRNAYEALRKRFNLLQQQGKLSPEQTFTPVCRRIPTKAQPNRYKMFCLNRTGRCALPGLTEVYATLITGSTSVPEVTRHRGRWVKK